MILSCFRGSICDNLQHVKRAAKNTDISILSIDEDLDANNIFNLYTNQRLDILMVDTEQKYILVNVSEDGFLQLNIELQPGQTSEGVLPDSFHKILTAIWDTSFASGKQISFYLVHNSKVYLFYTSCMKNKNEEIIGGVMFIRFFDSSPSKSKYMETNNQLYEEE